MTGDTQKIRSVSRIINSTRTLEGEGFVVNRPFPTPALSDFDPFLLLDQMGPVTLAPGEAKGAPDHPHRGFETVTYMLEGQMRHKDSQGNTGTLGPGDVQWMTAGAGVIHSEMPAAEFAHSGGRLHGFQLWVNLPGKDKLMRPRYQEIPAARIPTAESEDGRAHVRVIAGKAFGVQAAIDTRTPITYLHFQLQPGARVVQPVPREYNAFAYVVGGDGVFGEDERGAGVGQMVIFAQDGDQVSIVAPEDKESGLDVLLIAGVPLGEQVVRYGPFVMNTREEIQEAIEDFRSGRMGSIAS
jgi:quercetin 2,3-dioxygenase